MVRDTHPWPCERGSYTRYAPRPSSRRCGASCWELFLRGSVRPRRRSVASAHLLHFASMFLWILNVRKRLLALTIRAFTQRKLESKSIHKVFRTSLSLRELVTNALMLEVLQLPPFLCRPIHMSFSEKDCFRASRNNRKCHRKYK